MKNLSVSITDMYLRHGCAGCGVVGAALGFVQRNARHRDRSVRVFQPPPLDCLVGVMGHPFGAVGVGG